MPWLLGLAMLGAALLTAARLPAESGPPPDDLARARAELVDRAREYRLSLERLLVIQEAAAERAGETAVKRRDLYERGFVSRRELEESEGPARTAAAQSVETRRRLAEAEGVLAESLAAIEWARAAATATSAVSTPTVIGSTAGADLTPAIAADLDRFFAARFARELPVSARGQTRVHDQLGLDHRRALDVAVHPDSVEGRAVIEFLRVHRIPFLAFRGVVPGASTGAHVHVGRASARIVPAGGGSR